MAQVFHEWTRLEETLTRISQRGVERLPAGELLAFGRLYRRAAAELAFHRSHEADPERLAYLNDLVGRCYPHVYLAPRRSWPSVQRFFAVDFPCAFRRHLRWTLLAFLLCILPGLLGFAIAWHDRSIADQVLPADLLASSDYVAERHSTPTDWLPILERAPTATFILTHNIAITILDFAGGMTAGVVTIFSLVYNGLMLGVVAAVVGLHGAATARNFWGFVAPHGVLELTAIFIAGGAGFVLAYALLNPGEFPRRIALRESGKEALTLMLGVAAMLTVAGLIEGFFSPMNIPEAIKFIVATIEGILLFSYLVFAGRRQQKEAPENSGLMTPVPPL